MSNTLQSIVKERKLKDTLYGKVYLGNATYSSSPVPFPVVIKSYSRVLVESHTSRDGHHVAEDALNELRLHVSLSRCPHPHVVRMLDLRGDATHYHAILEFCSDGEFFGLVSRPDFSHDKARLYMKQLMLGLNYLHGNCVAHRDLSLENILLHDGVLKICDFGVAKECREGQLVQDEAPVGKRLYYAPEVFARIPYCAHKADMWSCGVILFVMLAKVFPYELCTLADDRFVKLCSGKIGQLLSGWHIHVDALAIDFMSRIFCPAEHRLSTTQALAHPYLQQQTCITETSGAIERAWQLRREADAAMRAQQAAQQQQPAEGQANAPAHAEGQPGQQSPNNAQPEPGAHS